mmetsp:Transcript_4116/g.7556  ORF Transcript_4116/g.7556 Transcript_4116/m.7556 type:complete len:1437 (-) Transcript_4116:160-4470(-)
MDMDNSLKATYQILNKVWHDVEKSVQMHEDEIRALLEDHNVKESSTELNYLVESVCHEFEDNFVELAEKVNKCLEIYLDTWTLATSRLQNTSTPKFAGATLFTAFSPGDHVMVACESSDVLAEAVSMNSEAADNKSDTSSRQQPAVAKQSRSRRFSGGWDEAALPCPLAAHYKSGRVLSVHTGGDCGCSFPLSTEACGDGRGVLARVLLDRGANDIVEVPISALSCFRQGPSATASPPSSASSSSSPSGSSYQIGQILLIAQPATSGVYLPATLIELQHQHQNQHFSEGSAKDGNNTNQSSVKEISVLFRDNNVSRLAVGELDAMGRSGENDSILLLDTTAALFNGTSRSIIGFLFRQIPELIKFQLRSQIKSFFAASTDSGRSHEKPLVWLMKALDEHLHRTWQRSLQTMFYCSDRLRTPPPRQSIALSSSWEKFAFTGGVKTSTPGSSACGLKDVSSAVDAEVKRIYDVIFPPRSGGVDEDNACASDPKNLTSSLLSSPEHHRGVKGNGQNSMYSTYLQQEYKQGQRISSTQHNVNLIGPKMNTKGDDFNVISCQDDFSYFNKSVMPFHFKDIPQEFNFGPDDVITDVTAGVDELAECYERLTSKVLLCQRIRHVCFMFEELFSVGVMLLDSIHHHSYKNDFLFSTTEVENKSFERAKLANWFDSCPNTNDPDDIDDEFNRDDDAFRNSRRRGRADSDASVSSMTRNRSESHGAREVAQASFDFQDIRRSGSNSNVPSLNLGEITPERSGDATEDEVLLKRKQPISSDHEILGGSSRLLQFLVGIANLANSFLVKILSQLPAPFEVEARDWSLSLASILSCRDFLISLLSKINLWHTAFASTYQQKQQVLASFNHTIDPVEAFLLQVLGDLHEMIPLKVDEAISFITHTMETSVVSSVWREDWDASSLYKKGQKVSAGVLTLILTCKSLLHSFIQSLRPHGNAVRRLSASIMTVSIRSVLNAYSALHPSRVRQAQVQKDLTAALASFVDLTQLLLDKGIFPTEVVDSGHDEMTSREKFVHLPIIHTSQKKVFKSTTARMGGNAASSGNETAQTHHFLENLNQFCDQSEQSEAGDKSGDSSGDSLPHSMSALHIDDYGFGDKDQEFMSVLKDNLLELMLLTYINVASPSAVNSFISNTTDNKSSLASGATTPPPLNDRTKSEGETTQTTNASAAKKKRRKRRSSGGLDTFDSYYNSSSGSVGYPEELLVLKPLLLQSNVCLNSKVVELSATTLQSILDCVQVLDASKKDGQLSGVFGGSSESSLPRKHLAEALFDSGHELLTCHGACNSKAGELFCSIDEKALTLMSASAQYVLTLLPAHRKEAMSDTYPPLTDEETDTKERLEAFLASYEGDVETFDTSLMSSAAEMSSIIEAFRFLDGDGVGCDRGPGASKSDNKQRNGVNDGSFTERSLTMSTRAPVQYDDGDELLFAWEER